MAERMGTPFLQQRLHSMLKAHIRETLPKMRTDLTERKKKLLDQIEQLGGLDETNVSSKMLQFNQ
jgi:DNA-binding transcriptional MocR family regulator